MCLIKQSFKSMTTSTDTRQRLLDAAESLLASQGIGATSLREIADRAGVNPALVKYHFGSKDDLLEETLRRRIEPINQRRMERLDELESEYGHEGIPLEEVLAAMIRPAVETGLGTGEGGRNFLKLFGRIFSEPASTMHLIRKQMTPVLQRFDQALEKSLPGMDAIDLGWRKMATMGVVQHSLLMLSTLGDIPSHQRPPIPLPVGPPDPERVLLQLVTFCAAGMRAGLPATPAKSGKAPSTHPSRPNSKKPGRPS